MEHVNDHQNKSKLKNTLEIRDVVKRYGDVMAVDHVSLYVKEGQIFSLLGPSGCGKSTLLRMIAGLESQDEGHILINSEVVDLLPPFKRDCSIVFQQLALFPHLTVFNNIAFGLVERKMGKREIKARTMKFLNLVNLENMEHRYPSQLSGGQQQRVALARSLVLEPEILLLDEPLAALDRKLRKEMQVELKRIQREVGTTFLNVTHDQKEALSLSDRIAVMKDGRVEQMGTPKEIYEQPQTQFVASFMGATNIFPGRVVTRKPGKVEIESLNGLRLTSPVTEDIDSERITGISVHPELICVDTNKEVCSLAASKGHNVFQGRIVEVFYQGDFSELTIALEQYDKSLTVYLNRSSDQEINLEGNQPVLIHWNWQHNNILVD
jgi:spermidine/putrescine transport system ATP-binding protein